MTNDERMAAARELAFGLTREGQLLLVQDLLADIRRSHFTDHDARNRAMREELQRLLEWEEAERAAGRDRRAAG
jgi:hypothetical protein